MSMPAVTLLMAVHCHQPVGNFGFVFEEAFAKSYEPFLRALESHPGIRMSLHYSGPLLDWIQRERPDFIERLKTLVSLGRVELLSSGYYEPLLPIIPERDRQGQIARMQGALADMTSRRPSGLWLTERVWEPELPATLARAGIEYTILDSSQFETARPWIAANSQLQDHEFWDLLGCFRTETEGQGITVFPASVRLRYWMPFQAPERTIDFLRGLRDRGPCAITFADDGEKFGFWPGTQRWVFEEGWLDRFFGAVEREADWLGTATFRQYLDESSPTQAVYLPSSSYREMMSWSAGAFRNFFIKYPEAQAMQQKMLRLSRSLERAQAKMRLQGSNGHAPATHIQTLIRAAAESLYAGQCNCAYWHGVFGGLYLSHLRRAVYRNLIEGEGKLAEANRLMGEPSDRAEPILVNSEDTDADGKPEILIQTPSLQMIIDPSDHGAITAWDVPAIGINLLDTLHRHHEPYHDNMRSKAWRPTGTPGEQAMRTDNGSPQREFSLVFDPSQRVAFADYALSGMPDLDAVTNGWWREKIVQAPSVYQWMRASEDPVGHIVLARRAAGASATKTIDIDSKENRVRCRFEVEDPSIPVVALEFNLAIRDERYLHLPGALLEARVFSVSEPQIGLSISVTVDSPGRLYHVPIETISESEAGLERSYQGLSLIWCWSLPVQRPWAVTLEWTASVTGDAAAVFQSAAGNPAVQKRSGRAARSA